MKQAPLPRPEAACSHMPTSAAIRLGLNMIKSSRAREEDRTSGERRHDRANMAESGTALHQRLADQR